MRDTIYRLVDMSGILTGLVISAKLQVAQLDEFYLLAGAGAIIIYYLLCEISGMYRNWRGVSIEREILCAVVTWIATIPFLLATSVMTRFAEWVDRSFVVLWTLLTLVIIVGIRIAVRLTQCYLRSRGYNTRGFAIVGINDLGLWARATNRKRTRTRSVTCGILRRSRCEPIAVNPWRSQSA